MLLLDDRKRKILKAIVDDYINTAEPVGSRSVARRHEIGLSSATIRNEMADLEDMGLLEQPHTSAGRVPSDKGYRVYVDQLMTRRQLSSDEIVCIEDSMKAELNELEQLIKQASAVVSEVTKYTSLAITPQMSKSTLKTIKLILVEDDKVLIVIFTNAGIAKNSLVKIGAGVSLDSLVVIANYLSDRLTGITLEMVNIESLRFDAQRIMTRDRHIIDPIINGVEDCINQIASAEVFLDGTANIFNFPEFQDMMRAKKFLSILNAKDILASMMFNSPQGEEIKVRIGIENEVDELKDFSLITATYSIDCEIIGSIGVIGPRRMHYPKVIASLNHIRKVINRELSNLLGDDVEGQ